MFKNKTNWEEIASDMENNLVKIASSEDNSALISDALEKIALAADMLDQEGRHEEADALTALIEGFASNEPHKTASSLESFLQNLKETGTMFPKSDFGGASDVSNAADGAQEGAELEIAEEDEKDLESRLKAFEDED